MNKAEQINNEQAVADKLEGFERASDDIYELILRHKELEALMAPLEAEKKAIAELVKEHQLKHGVVHLTHDGVELTTLSKTVRNNFDKKSASEKLGVEVLAEFYTQSQSYSLRFK